MKIKDEHQILQASQRKTDIARHRSHIDSNLRAPLTSVGPLVSSIRDSLGMTNAAAGTITTVPLLLHVCHRLYLYCPGASGPRLSYCHH